MAKQRKVVRARMPRDRSREESLLLRSAESLGRVIGILQRQLDQAAKSIGDGDGHVKSSSAKSNDKSKRPAKPNASRKRKIAR